MGIANKYNNTRKQYRYEYPENPVYIKLKDLPVGTNTEPEKIYPVKALYISSKGRFGDQPCLAMGSDTIVNLPSWMLDDVRQMMNDPEATQQINDGLLGFRIRIRAGKNGKKDYTALEWVDMEKTLPF